MQFKKTFDTVIFLPCNPMTAALCTFPSVAAHQQHRNVYGVVHRRHSLSEDQIVQSAVHVRSHDQHVDADLFHGFNDSLSRVSV